MLFVYAPSFFTLTVCRKAPLRRRHGRTVHSVVSENNILCDVTGVLTDVMLSTSRRLIYGIQNLFRNAASPTGWRAYSDGGFSIAVYSVPKAIDVPTFCAYD